MTIGFEGQWVIDADGVRGGIARIFPGTWTLCAMVRQLPDGAWSIRRRQFLDGRPLGEPWAAVHLNDGRSTLVPLSTLEPDL